MSEYEADSKILIELEQKFQAELTQRESTITTLRQQLAASQTELEQAKKTSTNLPTLTDDVLNAYNEREKLWAKTLTDKELELWITRGVTFLSLALNIGQALAK